MNDELLLEEIYGNIHVREVLVEGTGSDVGHLILDLAGIGFDVAGGSGAVFDFINVAWYTAEKSYLYAGLSLISAIPFIGDLIGKGGKWLIQVDKASKAGKGMQRAGAAMKSADTVAKLSKVKAFLKTPEAISGVDKILSGLSEKNSTIAQHADEIKGALDQFANEPVVQGV